MGNKQRLELTWIGKNNPDYDIANIEPRILEENKELSYGDKDSENMIIHGDNLLALKALLPEYEGKIKCVYIDPPYNTGNAFEHYDDSVEHSTWLSLMKPRLELIYMLLSEDGLLAVQIDDNEFAKLYFLLAEIFQERNIKTICVKMSEPTGVKMASVNSTGGIAKLKEYVILASKKGIKGLDLEKIPKGKWDYEYKTVCLGLSKDELQNIKSVMNDEDRTDFDIVKIEQLIGKITFSNAKVVCNQEKGVDPQEAWYFENAWRIVQFATLTGGGRDLAISKKNSYEVIPNVFHIVTPRKKLYFIKGEFNHKTKLPRCKLLFADQYLEVHAGDFWQDIRTTGLDNEGGVAFKNGKKPEALLKRIIGMCSKPKDLVMDSFLGSGTTAAVAHKMKRKYIGIEMGEHAYSHCIARLQKVIKGTDQGGITKSVEWAGGGGFKFYELAPSFIVNDEHGNPIIDSYYNDTKLIKAMCKLMNYTFKPSQKEYWKQGKGQGNNSLFVTTQLLSVAIVQQIARHLKESETLLICPKKYEPGCEKVDKRITIKKIPQSILKACQFGKKEYLLPIKDRPIEEIDEDDFAEEEE